jgi:hypothetical protein
MESKISCTGHYKISEIEGDHTTPWHLGEKTSAATCCARTITDGNRVNKQKTNEGKFCPYILNESKILVFLPLYRKQE